MAVEVYTDGACPFCRWVRGKVEPYDSGEELRWRDYNDPAVAAATPYSLEQLSREMHVRTPDGRWAAGFAAWVEILRVLPRWKWLAALLSAPPLRWIGPGVYRIVAANRYRIPGVPKPCDPTCRVEHPLNS